MTVADSSGAGGKGMMMRMDGWIGVMGLDGYGGRQMLMRMSRTGYVLFKLISVRRGEQKERQRRVGVGKQGVAKDKNQGKREMQREVKSKLQNVKSSMDALRNAQHHTKNWVLKKGWAHQ